MRNKILLFLFVFGLAIHFQADAKTLTPVPEADTSWVTGGAIGLDLSQLMLINPAMGAGEDRLAFGGINTLFAKYKKDKSMWDTEGVLQLAVQRLGESDNPFSKNIDILRINSKYGYALSEKLYGAALMNFETILLNTYNDLRLSSTGDNSLLAKFLSPASFLLAPGLDYVHDEHLSLFFSPFGYKAMIVLDDELAALGVHGNPYVSPTDFENIKHELGAAAKAKYTQVFADRVKYNGELNLFYDYLADEHGLEFVDVAFINDFGIEIMKGLSLNLLVDARWDRDIASMIDADEIDGLTEFKKWMIAETFVVKYNYVLK